jgi:hypothetical protein
MATENTVKKNKGGFIGAFILLSIAGLGYAKREQIKTFLKQIF